MAPQSATKAEVLEFKPSEILDFINAPQNQALPEIYTLHDLDEFLSFNLPPAEPFLGPILRRKQIMMIHAWRGLGKTFFGASLSLAVASGSSFLKWKAEKPRKVLYLDGEMDGAEFQERLKQLSAGMENRPPKGYFYPLNFDSQQAGTVPNIATPEGQQSIEHLISQSKAEVIVIDNLSCFAPISELDDESWMPVNSWLLSMRRKGITTVVIHHSGKNGSQRGISRREDNMNTVACLKRPTGYEDEEGLRCILTFEKQRGLKGEDVMPLEISLQDDHGNLTWL